MLTLLFPLCSLCQAQTLDELKLRAKAGDADAMHTIGVRYWLGEPAELECAPLECTTAFAWKDRNYTEAMHWLQLAADKGNDEAMNDVANMYQGGLGGTRNYDKAMYWRRLAAEKGNNAAMCGIGSMYVDGLGVKQDYAEAMRWYRKAADAGNDIAFDALAHGYEHGYGVKVNLPIAAYWYAKCANSSSCARVSSPKAELARLRKRGVVPAKSGDLPEGAAENHPTSPDKK
jgi:hypothetical protein